MSAVAIACRLTPRDGLREADSRIFCSSQPVLLTAIGEMRTRQRSNLVFAARYIS